MNETATSVPCALRWLVALGGPVVAVCLTSWLGAAVAQPAPPPRGIMLRAPTREVPVEHAPGTTLSAEVRVATALTPPPGVQQARALRDWSARLIAEAPGAPAGLHQYWLPVTNVRPVSGSSLDYRVQVPLPAWLAPGSYALAIAGPGGETLQADAVRIVRNDVGARAERVWLGATVGVAKPTQGVRFFPATTVGIPTQAPAVIALVNADQRVSELATVPGFRVVVEVEPSARAGFAATLHARGVPTGGIVAWSLSDGTTAYGPPHLRHMFEASGPFHGDLMAIGPDGAVATVHFQVEVAPGVRFGCQSQGPFGAGVGGWTITPLILSLALLKRRPRRSAGISSRP